MNNSQEIEALKKRISTIEGTDTWRGWFKLKTNKIAAISVLLSLIVAAIALFSPLSEHFKNDEKNDVANIVRGQLQPTVVEVQQLSIQMATTAAEVSSLTDNVKLLLGNALKTTASLSQSQFDRNLQVVAAQLAVAQKIKANLDPEIRQDIRQKLVRSTQQADKHLWVAKGDFLTSESARPATQFTSVQSIPPCDTPNMVNITYNGNFNCLFILDDRNLTNTIIRNSIVVYRGGPVNLQNVTLEHCYFIFDVKSVPKSSGQEYMNSLLASSDLARVVVGG